MRNVISLLENSEHLILTIVGEREERLLPITVKLSVLASSVSISSIFKKLIVTRTLTEINRDKAEKIRQVRNNSFKDFKSGNKNIIFI